MSRLIRVSGNQGRFLSPALHEAFDAAPDEATLPTIDWCVTHGVRGVGRAHLECRASEDPLPASQGPCRVVRVPVPVHLGAEMQP